MMCLNQPIVLGFCIRRQVRGLQVLVIDRLVVTVYHLHNESDQD